MDDIQFLGKSRMVANPLNYRRNIEQARSGTARFKNIEALRSMIQRGIEAVFLIRGHDKTFCREVTEEAMLAIHADIDRYTSRTEFRTWAIAIAIRIGFEKTRELHVARRKLSQRQRSRSSNAGASKTTADANGRDEIDPPKINGQERTLSSKEKLTVGELLRLHREMVRAILGGDNPLCVAESLNLSTDFQQVFLNEAVRKLNRLQLHLQVEFEGQTGSRCPNATALNQRARRH